jgi:hypothetical protein
MRAAAAMHAADAMRAIGAMRAVGLLVGVAAMKLFYACTHGVLLAHQVQCGT